VIEEEKNNKYDIKSCQKSIQKFKEQKKLFSLNIHA
jgi:hypothetical protein